MSTTGFNPDDPRLTAYALNELDAAERESVEQLLADYPEAQAALEEIQETAALLRGDLQTEPVPMLTESQRSVIADQADDGPSNDASGKSAATPASNGTARRRGRWIIPTLLTSAAAVAIAVPMLPPRGDNDETIAMSESPAMSDTTGLYGNAEFSDDQLASRMLDDSMEETKDVMALKEMAEGESSDFASEVGGAVLSASAGDSRALASGRSRTRAAFEDSSRPERAAGISGKNKPGGEADEYVADGRKRNNSSNQPVVAAVDGVTTSPAPTDKKAQPGDPQTTSAPVADRPVNRTIAKLDRSASAATGTPGPAKSFAEKGKLESEAKRLAKKKMSLAQQGQPSSSTARPTQANVLAGTPSLAGNQSGNGQPGRADAGSGFFGGGKQGSAGGGQVAGRSGRPDPFGAGGKRRPSGEKAESATPQVALLKPGSSRRNLSQDEALKKITDSVGREAQIEGRDRLRQQLRAQSGNEAYEPIVENAFITPDTEEKQLSTLSVDVDTASYSNVRRFIMDQHRLPPRNAVRIEELVNYFSYDYPQPEDGKPFSVTTQVAACPWQPQHRLARIGLKAKEIAEDQRPQTNLVFLLDTSGSMRAQNKLPLVREAMKTLTEGMTEDDRIAIVTYSSTADLRLPSTLGSKQGEIIQVIDSLHAGGSTNGAGGIQLAYDTAIKNYIQGGSNRVILCTDGDFNVGISDDNQLVELIQEKAASGVFLSVFGFGIGNLKDAKLEKLADKGNGHYGYIDNLREASRIFGKELTGTLYTVAKDVKLQVEFNPATVGAYRLIGYENRLLAAQDFTDDTKDAGEIGAGHTVTALYEIVPRATWLKRAGADKLRYQQAKDKEAAAQAESKFKDELLNVKLNYKKPDSEVSEGVSELIPVKDATDATKNPEGEFLFVASVASFGMNMRDSQYRGAWNVDDALNAAKQSLGEFKELPEDRADFVKLVEKTKSIIGPRPTLRTPAPARPLAPAVELSPAEARIKATVGGKYRRLVKRIEVRDDLQRFGGFYDYGAWDGNAYAGYKDLPEGNWVYVFPNWYIWAEVVGQEAGDQGGLVPPPKANANPPKNNPATEQPQEGSADPETKGAP